MRRIIIFDSIKYNKDFWLYFFSSSFPEALDSDSDLTLSEMILANYKCSKEWVDEFTSYYDGVFEENDGYVDNPNTLSIRLKEDTDLFIEFHPGDKIYFINDTEIGCTGPDYIINKISWKKFNDYSIELDCIEKLLLLPMIYVHNNEKEKLVEILYCGLQHMYFKDSDFDFICRAILENCFIG